MDKKTLALIIGCGILTSLLLHVESKPSPIPDGDEATTSTTPAPKTGGSPSDAFWGYMNKLGDMSKNIYNQLPTAQTVMDTAGTYAQKAKETALNVYNTVQEHGPAAYKKFMDMVKTAMDEISKKYNVTFPDGILASTPSIQDIMSMKYFPAMPENVKEELMKKFNEAWEVAKSFKDKVMENIG